MKAVFRRALHGFVPIDDESRKAFHRIKVGWLVILDVKKPARPRSYEQHKLFFALCKLIYENSDDWPDMESVREMLTIGGGHCVTYELTIPINGEMVRVVQRRAKSIAYEEMEQEEFNDFFAKVKDYVFNVLLPDQDSEVLFQEVWAMMEERPMVQGPLDRKALPPPDELQFDPE